MCLRVLKSIKKLPLNFSIWGFYRREHLEKVKGGTYSRYFVLGGPRIQMIGYRGNHRMYESFYHVTFLGVPGNA